MRRIAQETFDEVVQENIKDFDMSPNDALKEAVAQFESQGVDLSVIDVSGGIGKKEVLDCIECMKRFLDVDRKYVANEDGILSINLLCQLCSDKHEYGIRNQMLMNNKGGVNVIITLIDISTPASVLSNLLELLIIISRTNGT